LVKGIDKFKEYFQDYSEKYIIIGGTACEVLMNNAGFDFRATKDMDIVLVIEALDNSFVKRFWDFIKDGNYKTRERSTGKHEYFRFSKPSKNDFPSQIELFSRKPDIINTTEEVHLTPIPVEEGLASLSAILMNDDYYNFTIKHSSMEDDLHIAKTGALICLKAKAFLEMTERKNNGDKIDSNNIQKHKKDVFRLAVLLSESDSIILSESIKKDLKSFCLIVNGNLPDTDIYKEMNISELVKVEDVFNRLKKVFNLL
jgi:hypothetical protein